MLAYPGLHQTKY